MKDQPRNLLLDDLAQMAKGGIAESANALTNEEFFRYHMPIPEHQRILSREILLVLGGRGAGKSQLFQALRRLSDPAQLAISERMSQPANMSDVRIDYMVGFEKHGTAFPAAEDISAVLGGDPAQISRLLWLGLLAGVLLASNMHHDVFTSQLPGELVRQLQEALASPSRWLAALSKHLEDLNRALDHVERRLESDKASLVVTYDDLDVLAAKLTQVYPLVRELLALWLDRSRRWNRLRCKIFLRTDIFSAEALSFADSSKLRPNSLTLTWSQENLYWLLIKRLLNGDQAKLWKTYFASCVSDSPWKKVEPWGTVPRTSREHHQKIVGKMIGTYMGTDPKRGETYRWFFNHLQDSRGMITPRSFLKLFENAAERQRQEGIQRLCSDCLLSPSQIQGALQGVSIDRIAELADEEYPWVSALKKTLSGNTVPMPREEFASLLKQTQWEGASRPRHFQPEGIIDELLGLGIVRETDDKRIHVPDIYLYGFELKRKAASNVHSKAVSRLLARKRKKSNKKTARLFSAKSKRPIKE
ncbi:MAG: P-loop ATPase, Sll1717 family [bacterium]